MPEARHDLGLVGHACLVLGTLELGDSVLPSLLPLMQDIEVRLRTMSIRHFITLPAATSIL